MTVDEIRVNGTEMISCAEVINFMKSDEMFRGGFFGHFFPRDHWLFYKNDKYLSETIISHFPRAREVYFLRDYRNGIFFVNISERQGIATWCSVSEEDKNCFWIDKEGFIIGKAPYSRGSLVIVVKDETGKAISVGKEYISDDVLRNIIEATNMFMDFNWIIKEIKINDGLFNEAIFITAGGQKILINPNRDPKLEGRPVLKSIIASGKWPQVEYVDLRIEGRGFYKLR